MESDGIMIYQVVNFVQELPDNLTDLSRSEDYDLLPFNVEEIGISDRFNWMLEGSMKTRVSACAGTVQVAKHLKTMSEEERKVAKAKIKVAKEIMTFQNVKTGKETVEKYRKVFVPIIVEKVKGRFTLFEDDESFKAFRVFNITRWSPDQDTDQMLNADIRNIEILSKSFEYVLQGEKIQP